jgi:arylsulfatase
MKSKITIAGLLAVALALSTANSFAQATRPSPSASAAGKPNIIIIWGDDIGQSDVSAYSMGLMGFQTPNIDRVAHEGVMFTDYYAEQSCTAGRASFITGQCGLRTGNTTVGMPGATQGLQARDVTIAQLLKAQG